MKKTKIVVMLALLASVVGCNNGNRTSNQSTNSTSSSKNSASSESSIVLPTDYKVSSYYEAMTILRDLRNYTLTVTLTEGSYEFSNHIFYTKNAIFDDYVGDEYGYVQTEKGAMKVTYYEDNLFASDVLLKKDGTAYDTVWTKDFFSTFANINVDEFKDAGNEDFFDIKGKSNKIQFMNIVQAEQTDYENLVAVTAYMGEYLSDMMFTLEFKNNFGFSIEISNINSTKIPVIDNFLAAGNGPAEVSADLKRVKDLFSGFNYKRVLYYEDAIGDIKVAGHEYFNPDYFVTKFTEEYHLIDPTTISTSGYIGFNHKIIEGAERHGAYLFFLTEGDVSIFPQAAYHDPDITKFYNYPTYLSLFENLYFFEPVEGKEHSYRTTNFDLNLEFAENMQITETLANFHLDGLTITLDDAPEDENAKVTFVLEYSTDGIAGGPNSAVAEFEFVEFGLANIMELDVILANAEDAQ